jgi:hypothetical protein
VADNKNKEKHFNSLFSFSSRSLVSRAVLGVGALITSRNPSIFRLIAFSMSSVSRELEIPRFSSIKFAMK